MVVSGYQPGSPGSFTEGAGGSAGRLDRLVLLSPSLRREELVHFVGRVFGGLVVLVGLRVPCKGSQCHVFWFGPFFIDL